MKKIRPLIFALCASYAFVSPAASAELSDELIRASWDSRAARAVAELNRDWFALIDCNNWYLAIFRAFFR